MTLDYNTARGLGMVITITGLGTWFLWRLRPGRPLVRSGNAAIARRDIGLGLGVGILCQLPFTLCYLLDVRATMPWVLSIIAAVIGVSWGGYRTIRGIKAGFTLTTPLSPDELPPRGPRAERRRWFRGHSG